MAFDENVQFWVNGPCRLFVGTGAAGAYEELGFTENGVGVRFMGHEQILHSDRHGPETPTDSLIYQDDAFITFDLNEFDMDVWFKCLARIFNSTAQSGTAGTFGPGDPATLVKAEGCTYDLIVHAPYAVKNAFTGLNSHHFPAAYLAGQVDDGPRGSRQLKCAGMFHALPLDDEDTGNSTVYDSDVTGIPATPVVDT